MKEAREHAFARTKCILGESLVVDERGEERVLWMEQPGHWSFFIERVGLFVVLLAAATALTSYSSEKWAAFPALGVAFILGQANLGTNTLYVLTDRRILILTQEYGRRMGGSHVPVVQSFPLAEIAGYRKRSRLGGRATLVFRRLPAARAWFPWRRPTFIRLRTARDLESRLVALRNSGAVTFS